MNRVERFGLAVAALCLAGTAQAQIAVMDELRRWDATAYVAPQPRAAFEPAIDTNPDSEGPGGWVTLVFMVDASGRAFDIHAVAAAAGAPVDEAITQVRRASFAPARIGTRSVPGAYRVTLWFEDPAGEVAPASAAFAEAFAGSEPELLPTLAANPYEETLAALVQYNEAVAGESLATRFELLRALAEEPARLRGLPPEDVEKVLLAHYALAVRAGYPGAAFDAGEGLLARNLGEEVRGILDDTQTVLAALRDAPEAEFAGRVHIGATGHAAHALLRPGVRLAAISGELSGVRLHCEGGYLELEPATDVPFTTPLDTGRCRLVLSGTPGAALDVVQF